MTGLLDNIRQDLILALRSFVKDRVYSIVSVLTLITARTREMGIRMALGAGQNRIRQLVIRQGTTIASYGIALGPGVAGVTTRWLRSLLYEVSALDTLTLLVASLAILAVTVAASYVPARRATKVDPIAALRAE